MEMRPVDLQVIVTNLGKLLRRLIGEDVELVIEQEDTSLFVNADAGQLEQVLMNLTTNARDAMPDGGRITISSERRWLDHEFMSIFGWGNPGTYAVLTFSDTGEGIRREDQQKIFEPFYTSKSEGKGTGLGLSIVYGIVQQHGGHISLESAPGCGTTFTIYLPMLTRHLDLQEQGEQTVSRGGAETVLVCEDDPMVRRLVKMVLEDAGYVVLEAIDGQDAVDAFRKNLDMINLVILDVVMPKKNGVSVYSEIESLKPGMHFVFTSGYTPDSIRKSGVFDMKVPFLQKPVTPGVLLKKVRDVLDGVPV
jgi:CheY-like chemotaxis protein/two-component sensor histidine kinase